MICTICQEDKHPSNFRTLKTKTKDGVKSYQLSSCKSCNQKRAREWRQQKIASDPSYTDAVSIYNRTYREKVKNDPAKIERTRAYNRAYRAKFHQEAKSTPSQKVAIHEERTSHECHTCGVEKPMDAYRNRTLLTGRISYESRCKQCQTKRDLALKRERKQVPPGTPKAVSQRKRTVESERERGRRRWESLKADPIRYEAYLKRQRERDRKRNKVRYEALKNDPEKLEAYRQKGREKWARWAHKKLNTAGFEPTETARKAPTKRKKAKRKARKSGGSISNWLHKMAQQR